MLCVTRSPQVSNGAQGFPIVALCDGVKPGVKIWSCVNACVCVLLCLCVYVWAFYCLKVRMVAVQVFRWLLKGLITCFREGYVDLCRSWICLNMNAVFCVFVCETDNVYILLRYDKHYTCMAVCPCVPQQCESSFICDEWGDIVHVNNELLFPHTFLLEKAFLSLKLTRYMTNIAFHPARLWKKGRFETAVSGSFLHILWVIST